MYDPSNEPDPKIIKFLDVIETPILMAVALFATALMGFWLVPGLDRLAPAGWSQMSVHTAIGVILAAISLALSKPRTSTRSRRAGTVAAIAVVALGALVLVFDGLGLTTVGRADFQLPSPQTGMTFVLLGTTILLLKTDSLGLARDIATLLLWAMLLFMIGGHAFSAAELYIAPDGRLLSIQTLLSALAILFVVSSRQARADSVFAVAVNIGAGSRMLRTIAPAVMIAPFVIFGLVATLQANAFPAAFTRAVFAPLVVIGVFLIIGRMAMRINDLERSLRRQSVTDEMTGVLNHRGFAAVGDYLVQSSKRTQTPLTVFYFDLDGLKKVNDTLGHTTGSLLIKRFANLLTDSFRKNDVIGRLGGDEFAVLAKSDDTNAHKLVARIAENTALANREPHVPFSLSYSVGFAQLDPKNEHSLDQAIMIADGFMYERKNAKRRRANPADSQALGTAPNRLPDWSI